MGRLHQKARAEGRGKREEKTIQAGAVPVKETLTSLKGMVPKSKKKLSLEEMDQYIGKGDRK
jgi:hypothetical protein